MKLLLYCTKAKPYLYKTLDTMVEKCFGNYHTQLNKAVLNDSRLNGKIVAECEFTVFDIHPCASYRGGTEYGSNCMWATFTNEEELLKKSCLTRAELDSYLAPNRSSGYGIGIKNLHIFDKSKELSEFMTKRCQYAICSSCRYGKDNIKCDTIDNEVDKAPQNMMYCYGTNDKRYILISIQPQWLCKILNGEKTIEVRKKVLKGMSE